MFFPAATLVEGWTAAHHPARYDAGVITWIRQVKVRLDVVFTFKKRQTLLIWLASGFALSFETYLVDVLRRIHGVDLLGNLQ